MTKRIIGMKTLGMIAGTRVMLGLGLGLLLSDRLSDERRRECGWALLATGALATIPLLVEVLGSDVESEVRPAGNHRSRGAQVGVRA